MGGGSGEGGMLEDKKLPLRDRGVGMVAVTSRNWTAVGGTARGIELIIKYPVAT
jgi:hypothetical protein